MAANAYHSIEPRKHGGGAIRKTHNIIDHYGKHNRAKTRCQSAQLSLCGKFLRDFFSTGKILVAIENIKVLTLRHFRGILRGVALYCIAH